MEIVTYVLEGALEHKDSMGHGEVFRPGEFQRMSAGTGITHSEFNPSSDEPVHLYQIWLFPEQKGIEPSYEQEQFAEEERPNRLRLVAGQPPHVFIRSRLRHRFPEFWSKNLRRLHRRDFATARWAMNPPDARSPTRRGC